MQAFLVLFSALGAFGISIGVLTAFDEPGPSQSEQPVSQWEDVRSEMAVLQRIASQSCSFIDSTDQSAVFGSRYKEAVTAYQRTYDAARHNGATRPPDIPSTAPGLASLQGRFCPDAVASAAAPAASVEAQETPAGMDFEGLAAGAQFLTLEQLDAAAFLAGWPMTEGWWPEMRQIVQCESGRNIFAYNGSDPNGGSYGLAQLNGTQHFDRAGENFEHRFDPVVNLRTALWLRTARGHFGGAGGWMICSELYGIP
ncbi:MAG: hypothetical protein AB7T37_00855 [Dehalococcoidia bacterium]